MLSSTLMRQHLRCMQHLKNSSRIIKPATSTTLVPSQFLATSAVARSADHGKLWSVERGVSLAQIPALVVPFMWTNPMTDAIFCTLAVLHSHWGKIFSIPYLVEIRKFLIFYRH